MNECAPAFPLDPSLPCIAASPPLALRRSRLSSWPLSPLPRPARQRAAQGGGQGPAERHSPAPATQPPAPAPELVVERPGGKPLIREGQANRQLLGGTWYFRQDDTLVRATPSAGTPSAT